MDTVLDAQVQKTALTYKSMEDREGGNGVARGSTYRPGSCYIGVYGWFGAISPTVYNAIRLRFTNPNPNLNPNPNPNS